MVLDRSVVMNRLVQDQLGQEAKMIKAFQLKNFKAFEDTKKIELKPVTVLAGPNSGGKSSILQSLLLLKQTLETEVPGVALNLAGRFLQFSGFEELAFGKPSLGKCEVTYQFLVGTGLPSALFRRYGSDAPLAGPRGSGRHELRTSVEISFRHRKKGEDAPTVRPYRCVLKSFLGDLVGPELTIQLRGNRYVTKRVGKGEFGEFGPSSSRLRTMTDVEFNHFLPSYHYLKAVSDETVGPLDRDRIPLDPLFRIPLARLRHELEDNLRYLGPLREEPRRAYLHSGSPSPEIGRKGEYAAQVLWVEKDRRVRFVRNLHEEPVTSTLMEAVSQTFVNLGVAEPIDVSSMKRLIYQVLFRIGQKSSGKQVTIADVGFGMSQLLPIVVIGLRSPESSMLIFEQPEIHLHPKLQSKLADFMLGLAAVGKRVLVETHSDYFIHRLRRRIAEDKSDAMRNDVSILFVRPPMDNGGAVVEPLCVDEYGVIKNWPPDFFPESGDEAEAIIRASLEKREGQSR